MGKSWLLTRLRAIAQERRIPTARITFDQAYGGSKFQSDFALALHVIRAQLGAPCPRFDLAYAMYRFKAEGGLRPEFQGESWLAGAYAMVTKLAECGLLALNPGLAQQGAAFEAWLLEKLGEEVAPKVRDCAAGRWLLQQAGLEDYIRLLTSEAQPILRELPSSLAQDLEQNLPGSTDLLQWAKCRAVILFDGCEWLKEDAWLRSFCAQALPVQFVFAGQAPLNWGDPYWVQSGRLERLELGGLPKTDAREYLIKRELTDVAVQNGILETCQEGDGCTFHALSLGWCADTVLLEQKEGQWRGQFKLPPGDLHALAERFLRALPGDEQRWVESLALSPRFDEQAARWQHSEGRSRAQEAAWQKLTAFSIVAPVGEGWYTLRPLARRAIAAHLTAGRGGELRKERERWLEYWSKRSTTTLDEAAELAWNQQWFLDPQAATDHWANLAQLARSKPPLDMSFHYRLLSWWYSIDFLEKVSWNKIDAFASNCLAAELLNASLGDRTKMIESAIALCNKALSVRTREAEPQAWVATHNLLGVAYYNLPTGNHDENLLKAIQCYQLVLEVVTRKTDPQGWAGTQNNLGNAFAGLAINRDEHLRKAIECFQLSLEVMTREEFPQEWAVTRINLGLAYSNLPSGDRDDNLRKATQHFQLALEVITREEFPREWAGIQTNLGLAYTHLPGRPTENLLEAIQCYQLALEVFTPDLFPRDWAVAQNNMGLAYSYLLTENRDEHLGKAIECFQLALKVRSREAFPQSWATTQNNLGIAYAGLRTDRDQNLLKAIQCYQLSLEVKTRKNSPQQWATTRTNLGIAYLDLTTDRDENLGKAIECFQLALEVATREEFPQEWAVAQYHLGAAFLLRAVESPHLLWPRDSEDLVKAWQHMLRLYNAPELRHSGVTLSSVTRRLDDIRRIAAQRGCNLD